MNERGREVLVAAALRGQKQARGSFVVRDALCALGVLGDACGLDLSRECEYPFEVFGREYGLSREQRFDCPECSGRFHELALIAHLNDVHDADFLTIARKLGDATPVDGAESA